MERESALVLGVGSGGGEVLNATPRLVLCELGPDAHGLESLSPFCLKIHRALKFHGLQYERRHALRPSDHKQYNPNAQVPVLLIEDRPVPDSTEILKALETLTKKTLIPADPQHAAAAWLWEDYADRVLGYYVFAARWFDDRNWDAVRTEQFGSLPRWLRGWLPGLLRRRILKKMSVMEFIRAGQDGCWRMFRMHLDQLEGVAPESGFWISEQPTVADIGLFGILHCLRSDISPWQRDQINARPRLRAWLERVDAVTH